MDGVDHIKFMRRALILARRGMGRTTPNPCVGAVVVRNGVVIGEGWHRAAGFPHAEIEAIENARRKSFNVRGSTLYVTLEPCCTWGKTSPCTKTIVSEGIRRVIIGTRDPNPKHRGRGIRLLRKAGVELMENVLCEECERLNQMWNHWIVHQTPWVIAKCGMTLDGKIATVNGESRWITSQPSQRKAQHLRSRVDAVLVGVNTVLKDDPHLTVRYPRLLAVQPLCVILDMHARTPPKAGIFGSTPERVWIFVGWKAPRRRVERLQKNGANVVRTRNAECGTRSIQNGKLKTQNLAPQRRVDLKAVLRVLGKAGVTSVLVEGGGEVLGSFFREKRIHEIVFFIAPMILGGRDSIKAVAGEGFPKWQKSLPLEDMRVHKIGSDLMVCAKVQGS